MGAIKAKQNALVVASVRQLAIANRVLTPYERRIG
jgi:hypothetical protein